jgi:hypothetical protein
MSITKGKYLETIVDMRHLTYEPLFSSTALLLTSSVIVPKFPSNLVPHQIQLITCQIAKLSLSHLATILLSFTNNPVSQVL